MKRIIPMLALLAIAASAHAVPIAATVTTNTQTVIGYKEVTKTYNGWGGGFMHIFGHKKKHYQVPIYSELTHNDPVSSVPESSTYAMLLAGMGLIAWRVGRKA